MSHLSDRVASSDWGMLLLRLALAAVCIAQGYVKLFIMGPDMVAAKLFTPIGIPLPLLSAWVVALVEFIGGIALALGLFTRIAALLIGIVMVVAIFTVKISVPFLNSGPPPGAELDVAILGGVAALLFSGPGRLSLARLLFHRE